MRVLFVLIPLTFILTSFARSEESLPSEFAFEPIVLQSSASDALNEDPIVPAFSSERLERSVRTRGTVSQDFSSVIPLPVTDQGSAGAISQVRGVGRSSEETVVQTLGVPLNLPQGAGADLSVFPAFLWDRYRFQLSGAHGGYDPRGVGGTLTLVPWTASQISGERGNHFASQSFSGQISESVAGYSGAKMAALLGYESGKVDGVAGSASAEIFRKKNAQLRLHLLGSRREAELPEFSLAPGTDQRQMTTRVIPVLEGGIQGETIQTRHTVFHDENRIRTLTVSSGSTDLISSSQTGIENHLRMNSWDAGLSMRRVGFSSDFFTSPSEWLAHFSLKRGFQLSDVLVEPSFQVDGSDLIGAQAGGSFGIRWSLSEERALFARIASVPKLPSLLNRFYSYDGTSIDWTYLPNPDLNVERVWSLTAGWQEEHGDFASRLIGLLQFREGVQLNTQTGSGIQVQNRGQARAFHVMHTIEWNPVADFWIDHSVNFAFSRVHETGTSFPYLPLVTDVIRLAYRPGAAGPEAFLGIRTLSKSTSDAEGTEHPGYALLDLGANHRVWTNGAKSVSLRGGIENLLDRRVQVTNGYPLPGRIASLGISGQF